MNTLDYIIIALLLYLIIRGIFRGLIRESFCIVGVILGILLGNLFQPWMTGNLKPYIPMSQFLPLLSFIFIFVCILVIFNILGWAMNLTFRDAFTGWRDKTFGAMLAFLKGAIITYLVVIMLSFYISEKTSFINNSVFAPLIIKSYKRVTGLFSPDHYKNWKKKLVGETKKIGDTATNKLKDLVNKND